MSDETIQNWSLEHPPKHVLTIRRLIESQEREHGRKVGLIIDLANHDCLYIDDLLAYNEEVGARREAIVEYVHVGLVAKELPPQEVIDQVQDVAREFWERKPDSYICLHCCYGFNRTGFVMCSYLCQVHGMGVEESLESFARARAPGVKHKKFVEALQARYGGGDGVTGFTGVGGGDLGREATIRDGGVGSGRLGGRRRGGHGRRGFGVGAAWRLEGRRGSRNNPAARDTGGVLGIGTYVNIEFRRLDDVDDPGRVSPEVQACHMPDWHVDEERPEFDAAIPDSIIPRSAW